MLSVIYYMCRPTEVALSDDYVETRKKLFQEKTGKRLSEYSDGVIDSIKNAEFRAWWSRGRILLFLIALATYFSIFCCLFVVTLYYTIFFSFTDDNFFCNSYKSRHDLSLFGSMLIFVVSWISFYVVC